MFENADHVKLLLELLVGVVDAELLEAVHLERLKPGHNSSPRFPATVFLTLIKNEDEIIAPHPPVDV